MYEQVYEPVANNLALSSLVAVIPIVVLFALLAGIRMAAQWASLITLAVALVIAVVVYQMPLGLALNSTLLGICFGLFPIVWIVINAIFIYNVIVDTGLFETIRDSLAGVSNDRRIGRRARRDGALADGRPPDAGARRDHPRHARDRDGGLPQDARGLAGGR